MLGHGDDRLEFPGGWPGDARDAFAQAGRTPEEQATFETFRDLLKLRKAHPALRRGTTTQVAATDQAYAYTRQGAGEQILVVFNFGKAAAKLSLPVEIGGSGRTFRRVWGEGMIQAETLAPLAEVPAEQAAVFMIE